MDAIVAKTLNIDPANAHKVQAAIRQSWANDIAPEVTHIFIEQTSASPEKTVREKANLLLALIDRRTRHFTDEITLTPLVDYPLVWAKNESEFRGLINLNQELKNIKTFTHDIHTQLLVALEAQGYDHLERYRLATEASEKAFVAMSFDSGKVFVPDLTATYLASISPAIEDAGYRAVRVDMEEHNDYIMDKVISEIRTAKFVVAEFSQHRNGVYYEAAFARGLGLRVISVCHESEIGGAHFDTRQLNHIVWKNGDELKERLTKRIEATIGKGPVRKN